MMKQMIIMEQEQVCVEYVDSIEEMLNSGKYLGFKTTIDDRYMVVICGPGKGMAVNALEVWCDPGELKKSDGEFFSFDTEKELYEWMIEKDII